MSEVEKSLAREEERRRNRERFPQMSKFVDEMRQYFGEVKVLYVKEGDQEAGTPSSDEGWVQLTPGDGYVGSKRSGKKAR